MWTLEEAKSKKTFNRLSATLFEGFEQATDGV